MVTRAASYPIIGLAGLLACGGARPDAAAPRATGTAQRTAPVYPGIDITESVALGMVDGPSTAELTVIEAFDFACPHCERMQGPIDELVREYGGRVRVVYKNYVLPQHATAAHLAGCAAGMQGKFRAFADAVRAERASHAPTNEDFDAAIASGNIEGLLRGPELDLSALAHRIGLDMGRFDADRSGESCRAFLERDVREIERLDVDHIPVFFVADKRGDAMSKEQLRALIDAGLAATR
jgi:predicted DsbA family dithiol-disulfide isomerase